MDIDEGTDQANPSSTVDVEQALLHQFSCMGTTDRDELIMQLQKLLNKSINYSTAAFFLDMNNWNLQAAICSYLDVDVPPNVPPSMCLVTDPATDRRKCVEPLTTFQQTWCLSNNGSQCWPAGCYAKQCSDGWILDVRDKFPVPCLYPGGTYRLVVEFVSPDHTGVFESFWGLHLPDGSTFGESMSVVVEVAETTLRLRQQLSHFKALGSQPEQNSTIPNPFNLGFNKENDETGMC